MQIVTGHPVHWSPIESKDWEHLLNNKWYFVWLETIYSNSDSDHLEVGNEQFDFDLEFGFGLF